MPNWCNNKLEVHGPEDDVKRFKERAVGFSAWAADKVEENILNFHSLVPVPQDVIEAGYEDTGYTWERQNWGCKWGSCFAQLMDEWDGHLTYTFDTAWSPPIELLKRLGPKWPTLTFILDYEEMAMGFKGITKVKGDFVEDHCLIL